MKFGKKLAGFGVGISALALSFVGVASAHVTVRPGEALTGAFMTFNVGVPVEKDMPTTAVKLEVPAGLGHVIPTVKSGWTIQVEKEGSGEEAVVKSITWSGNEIGAGYRDDFTFSAKTPDKATELQWKAYQIYSDGNVVAWDLTEDKQPKKADGSPDFSKSGPFSVTKVTSETAADTANKHAHDNAHDAQSTAKWALYVGIAGIILAFVAIFFATRKPKA
ncbi:MAG TPA: DUF1775 domain-containing protein [Candidatus Saccharimonadales bacterium]|nr:DUF1775 domain-containing protein [Candidatus Saccharimonadales bacterium]